MTQSQLRKDFEDARAAARTLRDQIRVKLHLAGMDAKEAFQQLEKEADGLSRDIDKAAQNAMDDVVKRLQKLAAALRETTKP